MVGNMRRLCTILAAIGALHIDGARAQEAGPKHQWSSIENAEAAKAEINGQPVADFEDHMKDRNDVEAALFGPSKKLQTGTRAMWAVVEKNGTIRSFAGTMDGGSNESKTGDLLAHNFSASLTATAADPNPATDTHRARFLLTVIPEIDIDVTLRGQAPRSALRDHKITVEMKIEAEASTDRNQFNVGWSVSPSKKISLEAVVRMAKPGDPVANKRGDIFHDVTVKVDDVTRPKSDAYFPGEMGNAGGKIVFSEMLKSAMTLRLNEPERYFLKLARMWLKTTMKVTVLSSQPAAGTGDVVECHANLIVENSLLYDIDEAIGKDVGEAAKQLKSVPNKPNK